MFQFIEHSCFDVSSESEMPQPRYATPPCYTHELQESRLPADLSRLLVGLAMFEQKQIKVWAVATSWSR